MLQLSLRQFACIAYFLLFACFTFIFQPGHAQLNYLSSTEGGSSYEVCLEGDYLYVGAANTLKVFSLYGPQNTPDSNTFSMRLPSNIDQILVRDGYLYVCANHAGLWKFDISNTPATPDSITKYVPADINESIYDVAFYGDTIVVAAKHKVMLLSDSANTLTYLDTIATYAGTSRVHGVDIKGDFLAYTLGFSANQAQDGVYLIDLTTLQELDFFNETSADPWEVYFGQDNQLLHVMGGNIPLTVKGLYYALDYTIPTALQLAFSDTIVGFGNSFAMPMSAEIIHDTVYVATHGGTEIGYSLPTPLTGQVWVYDATDSSNVQRIEDLYAGLYHFDIAIEESSRTMYVASEWYGVLTVDISDISNEVSLGKTLTGGWCNGSAYARDRLVEASEGYGVRLFDMTYPQSPQLIAEDTAVGFCRAVSIDDTAKYVYAWHLTLNQFRVYDADDLTLKADTTLPILPFHIFNEFEKSRIHGDYVAVLEEIVSILGFKTSYVTVMNIANPLAPFLQWKRQKSQLEDLLFHPSGNLLVCSRDSIIVLEPSTMNVLGALQASGGTGFRGMTLSQDTLYIVNMSTNGAVDRLARYYLNPSTFSFTLIDNTNFPMASNYRIHMATNDTVLYIAGSLDQLKAHSKNPPYSALDIYDHSADHMLDNFWGVTDLYYSQGLLVLNEYTGQSSLFGNSVLVSVGEPLAPQAGRIYPNPTNDGFALRLETPETGSIEVFDLNGRKQYAAANYPMGSNIPTDGWESGIYFVVWNQGYVRWTGKLVKVE